MDEQTSKYSESRTNETTKHTFICARVGSSHGRTSDGIDSFNFLDDTRSRSTDQLPAKLRYGDAASQTNRASMETSCCIIIIWQNETISLRRKSFPRLTSTTTRRDATRRRQRRLRNQVSMTRCRSLARSLGRPHWRHFFGAAGRRMDEQTRMDYSVNGSVRLPVVTG